MKISNNANNKRENMEKADINVVIHIYLNKPLKYLLNYTIPGHLFTCH